MIPKIIHYCWFGGKPLPDEAKKCIASWERYFPDYEIKEWNETNYDLNCCAYVKEAYNAKKWAFVSDYARFDILYKYGGLYFDTDVEVISSMEDLIENGSFIGLESGNLYALADGSVLNSDGNIVDDVKVAPGLGLAAVPGLQLYKEIIDLYKKRHFILSDGSQDVKTVVDFVTEIFLKNKIKVCKGIGYCDGICVYPVDYFCPKDYKTGVLNITKNTRSIHHYTASWITPTVKKILKYDNKCKDIFGVKIGMFVSRIITAHLRVKNKIEIYKNKGI